MEGFVVVGHVNRKRFGNCTNMGPGLGLGVSQRGQRSCGLAYGTVGRRRLSSSRAGWTSQVNGVGCSVEWVSRLLALDIGPLHDVDPQFLALIGAMGGAVLVGSLVALFIITV
uniref:Uncharacterized protein n=1 Tax=Compsopogon caeruleus TaxID=31354 RepID=A0A7S1TEP0_9RHOD